MLPFTWLDTLVPAVALALLTWLAANLTATRRLHRRIQRDLSIASQLPAGRARSRIEVAAELDAVEYGTRRARGALTRTWVLFVLAVLTFLSFAIALVHELIAGGPDDGGWYMDFVFLPLSSVALAVALTLQMRREERKKRAEREAVIETEVKRRQGRATRAEAPIGARSGVRSSPRR